MKKITLSLFVCMVVMLHGCASVVTGGVQTLSFNSDPDKVQVLVDGVVVGVTPLTIDVKRGKGKTLTFRKDGYEDYTQQMHTHTEGWFWGNIMIGGLLGSSTDAASGSIYEYGPDMFIVNMKPLEQTALSVSSDKQKVKGLIVKFGSELRMELVKQDGENLNALLTMIKSGERAEKIENLSKLADTYSDDVELASKVVAFFEII